MKFKMNVTPAEIMTKLYCLIHIITNEKGMATKLVKLERYYRNAITMVANSKHDIRSSRSKEMYNHSALSFAGKPVVYMSFSRHSMIQISLMYVQFTDHTVDSHYFKM
jgi:hypothetical protein